MIKFYIFCVRFRVLYIDDFAYSDGNTSSLIKADVALLKNDTQISSWEIF